MNRKFNSYIRSLYDYIRMGELTHTAICCPYDLYEMATDMRNQAFADGNVDVSIKVDTNDELTDDQIQLIFYHGGNIFSHPTIETHTLTFSTDKEE